MNKALPICAAMAFVLSAPAHADDYITDDPHSMFYRETFEAWDDLDKLFADLSFATRGVLFPCEAWSPNFGPNDPPPPIDPLTPLVPITPLIPITPVVPVPEPSTIAMMILGVMALLGMKWRRA